MRTKVTLVLLLLNVVLFFVIFRVERYRTGNLALEVRHRVLGAEAADIRTLAVESAAAGGSYRLERRGDDWFITEPWVWRANPNAVSRIISQLQFLNNETSFSVADVEKSGQRLADYGLDPAPLVVRFSSGGADTTGQPAATTTLRIGSATKVGQRLYVLSPDGRRIHVVERTALDGLMLPLARLRSNAVLTIPEFEAQSLNFQSPSGSRILIQRGGSRWTFETPISARASRDAIRLAINQLNALQAVAFDPGAAALPPSATLRVSLEGDNRRQTLFLAAEPDASGDTAAQLEDPSQPDGRSIRFTVRLPATLSATLADAVDLLRDPHVLDFDPAAVTAITLQAPGSPDLLLQRLEPGAPAAGAPASWQILLPASPGQGPRTLRADTAAVQSLLGELAELAAQPLADGRPGFLSDAPTDADLENWGFNRPERRVTLNQPASSGPDATPATQVLEIGRTHAGDPLVNARVADAPSVYAVLPDILRQTPVAPRDWRDRRLRTPDSARVAALSLTDLSNGSVLWSWPSPSLPAARAAAAEGLAADVLDLSARRFVADSFSVAGVDGKPWRYRLDATLVLPGGGSAETRSVHGLFLAERTGASEQLAGAAEFDAVFVPGQRLIDELWTLTHADRDPGAPPPAGK